MHDGSSVGSKAVHLVIALAVGLVMGGCSGAKHLSDGHLAYNEAVREASDQELLLNIVRLRYLDSLEFLSIASINSTVRFSVGINAAGIPRLGQPGRPPDLPVPDDLDEWPRYSL